jgi:hypothetical protein
MFDLLKKAARAGAPARDGRSTGADYSRSPPEINGAPGLLERLGGKGARERLGRAAKSRPFEAARPPVWRNAETLQQFNSDALAREGRAIGKCLESFSKSSR